MVFSANLKDQLPASAKDELCLRLPETMAKAQETEYFTLNQDLILAFTPRRESRPSPARPRRDTTLFQLQYASNHLSDSLRLLKQNFSAAWCRVQQTVYDLELQGANQGESATLAASYGRPLKALPHGDVFAVHPCRTVSADRLTLVPSLRTDYDPVLYRGLNIPVGPHRCFSRPLVSFWPEDQSASELVYAQVAPCFSHTLKPATEKMNFFGPRW